jgi:hypothetical protein
VMVNLLCFAVMCTIVLLAIFGDKSPFLNWKAWLTTIYIGVVLTLLCGLIYYIYGRLDESAFVVGWIAFALGWPYQFVHENSTRGKA